MSQAPQIIFHSQLPSNKPRFMVRNSDGSDHQLAIYQTNVYEN